MIESAEQSRQIAVTPEDALALPSSLDLRLVSRRPSRLAEATARFAMELSPPRSPGLAGRPRASILILTHNQLAFTKLCLATLVPEAQRSEAEIVVVDNASSDGTIHYLQQLSTRARNVRALFNATNIGFAAGNNLAASAASGNVLLLLNNDTLLAPGSIDRLCAPLHDNPSIGMIGPVTNRACNEAEVSAPYRTFGGFAESAVQRANGSSTLSDIAMLAMFCVAMRRSVYEQIGPLDEQFGMGMFEDDDYAMRIAAAGMRIVCHEGVLVHHFGESSFGDLVPGGEHARLFEENRRRFETKWNRAWRPHGRRDDPARQAGLGAIRRAICEKLPPDSRIAVISKGDDSLLQLDPCSSIHFPQDASGHYSGHHPADGADVIAAVDRALIAGATHLLIPAEAFWWIEFYTALRPLFDSPSALVHGDPTCRIYRIGRGMA